MATPSCGNGTNFDWLRKSCDISTCDLSPGGNPEKYGRPMKSAILNESLYLRIKKQQIRKYHNHTPQTNPWRREEESQNMYSNKTSVRQ